MSKHEALSMELSELKQKNVCIDAIAIQETWDIRYPELVSLEGFNPVIFKRRRDMRGGGVGFYIRSGLQAEIIETLSPFENKIIEAITVQLSYPNTGKKVLLSSIYRSNGPIVNVTASQQLESFMNSFSHLLNDLNATNRTSFVFLDANINLFNLQNADVSHYMNCILEKGFLQLITKATRIQNDSKTLIDHVLSNSRDLNICSGTLISDVSDHYFTFLLSSHAPAPKQTHRTVVTRDFSLANLLEFRGRLATADWTCVYDKSEVDAAYDEFWNIYSLIYNQTFQAKRQRFNKNIHKLQNFMTNGLLISRKTKNLLYKASISDPSMVNRVKYTTYKAVYQRVLRAAKKLYFTSKLEQNVKNPKKPGKL
jgi:hypothetical protein